MMVNAHSKETLLLSAQNVSLYLGGRFVLQDVSLEVQAGKIITLVGPNGAGKTSLLRVLLRLCIPQSGKVWSIPKLKIGYVPQRLSITPFLPMTGERFLDLPKKQARESLDQVCSQAGIPISLLKTPVASLSGGEWQRLLLARALLRKPDLLILDEPVQGVDFAGQADLYLLLLNLVQTVGYGMLLVSHDLHFVMSGTHEIVYLNRHICCKGNAQELCQSPPFLGFLGRQADFPLAFYAHERYHSEGLE